VTRTNALEKLMIASFVRGLSVRDVEAALAEAPGDQAAVSKSTVSAICQAIKDEYPGVGRPPARRGGAGLPVPGRQPLPDAPGFPGRAGARGLGHHHQRQARVHRSGAPGTAESADAWSSFLTDLKDRGLGSPLIIINDCAPGLITAIEQTYPKGAIFQAAF